MESLLFVPSRISSRAATCCRIRTFSLLGPNSCRPVPTPFMLTRKVGVLKLLMWMWRKEIEQLININWLLQLTCPRLPLFDLWSSGLENRWAENGFLICSVDLSLTPPGSLSDVQTQQRQSNQSQPVNKEQILQGRGTVHVSAWRMGDNQKLRASLWCSGQSRHLYPFCFF